MLRPMPFPAASLGSVQGFVLSVLCSLLAQQMHTMLIEAFTVAYGADGQGLVQIPAYANDKLP